VKEREKERERERERESKRERERERELVFVRKFVVEQMGFSHAVCARKSASQPTYAVSLCSWSVIRSAW
jgi:hypothetical protein